MSPGIGRQTAVTTTAVEIERAALAVVRAAVGQGEAVPAAAAKATATLGQGEAVPAAAAVTGEQGEAGGAAIVATAAKQEAANRDAALGVTIVPPVCATDSGRRVVVQAGTGQNPETRGGSLGVAQLAAPSEGRPSTRMPRWMSLIPRFSRNCPPCPALWRKRSPAIW